MSDIKLIIFDPLISGPWMVGLFPDVLYAVYHLIADTSEIAPDQSCILIYSHCKHCFYDFLKINEYKRNENKSLNIIMKHQNHEIQRNKQTLLSKNKQTNLVPW